MNDRRVFSLRLWIIRGLPRRLTGFDLGKHCLKDLEHGSETGFICWGRDLKEICGLISNQEFDSPVELSCKEAFSLSFPKVVFTSMTARGETASPPGE